MSVEQQERAGSGRQPHLRAQALEEAVQGDRVGPAVDNVARLDEDGVAAGPLALEVDEARAAEDRGQGGEVAMDVTWVRASRRVRCGRCGGSREIERRTDCDDALGEDRAAAVREGGTVVVEWGRRGFVRCLVDEGWL